MIEHPIVSIVMPCLNEAMTLAACIREVRESLSEAGIAHEVVIADNGSTDGSIEIALTNGARVVRVKTPGYGSALMGGFENARGKYIVMADADESYRFSDAPAIIAKLNEGYDLVVGNRFMGGIDKGAMPFLHKYLGNPVLSFIGQLFFRTSVGDFHCGLRGFNRERILALGLDSTGMEFASEMVLRSALFNYSMTEIPTILRVDGRDRRPHLRTWRDGWRHLKLLLLYCPLWLFIIPGLTLVLSGSILMISLLQGPINFFGARLDVHTMIYAALFQTIGVEIASLGMFARGYAESLGLRPRTVGKIKIPMELGLLFGIILVLCGMAGTGYAITKWSSSSFTFMNPTESLRTVIPSALAITFGFQIIFLSFAMSVMELSKRPATSNE